jgi:phage terminase large subunit-like protein
MKLTPKIIKRMHEDPVIRRAVTKRSPEAFFGFYLPHYMEFQSAPFHQQLFKMIEDDSIKLMVVQGFRNSGKSTILSQCFPLWSAVSGRAQEILVFSKNQMLSRHILRNIGDELQENELLVNDFRPFDYERDQFGAYAIMLQRYHAEILAVSRDQAIRGVKRRQHRPQLIIIDDVDDTSSVATQDSRDATWSWFTRDIAQLGNRNTRIVVIGSPLHEDSLIMRLDRKIKAGEMKGVSIRIPIVDEENKPLWPAKFPTPQLIEDERMKMDEVSWAREMMLKIVPEHGQLITYDDIVYYDTQPSYNGEEYCGSVLSVDLAFKVKESSDYTAMVTGDIFGYAADRVIYIQPNPLNKRMPPNESFAEAKARATDGVGQQKKIITEDVGGLYIFIDQLKQAGLPVEAFQIKGQDKRERYSLIVNWIKTGRVRFPRKGCERLIEQMVGFEIERFDDLLDAVVQMVLYVMQNNTPKQGGFAFIDLGPTPDTGGLLPPDYSYTPLIGRRSYGRSSNSDLNNLLSGAASKFLNR